VTDSSRAAAGLCQFTFDGRTIYAKPGQTIAGALHDAGIHVVSRSFKYHRPRGLFCASGRCPNCLCTVDGEPNVRICTRKAETNAIVQTQNAWPSVNFDVMSVFNSLDRWMPVGFYYKSMHKPREAWPMFESVIRQIAGLGSIDAVGGADGEYDKANLFADVAVVGGGWAGLHAALAAAQFGCDVVLIDEQTQLGGHLRHDPDLAPPDFADVVQKVRTSGRITVLTETLNFGLYEGNYLAAQRGNRLYRIRADQVVLAVGGWERPFVFEHNDRPGILLASAAQRLVHLDQCKLEGSAVVVTDNPQGYRTANQLAKAGTSIAALIDLNETPCADGRGLPVRTGKTILSAQGTMHVTAAVIGSLSGSIADVQTIPCRWIIQAIGFTPATSLLHQAGCRLVYDPAYDHPRVEAYVKGVHSAGAVNGAHEPILVAWEGRQAGLAAAAAVQPDSFPLKSALQEHESRKPVVGQSAAKAVYVTGSNKKKKFVCLCEDVTEKDINDAIDEGYSNVETLKRYSTISMGPCQGKMCQATAIALCARRNGQSIEETGTTTSRPPEQPVPLGVLAGKSVRFNVVRRTALHDWHEEHHARFLDAGAWKRPEHYGDPHAEYAAVRHACGLIDVSTLGKMELRGRDVVKFLEFVYPNRFEKLAVGKLRYGVICDEAGVLLDDGTIARLGPERFFLTTTTGNADAIDSWFRSWLTRRPEWDVRLTNVSTCYAGMNIAGPKARDILSKVTNADISAKTMPYLAAAEIDVAGVPAVALRLGFVGELGFELHVPTQYGLHVWKSLLAAGQNEGIRPFGVEAQRRLRLEKKHLLPGVDTDALSNLYDADLPWIVKLDKDDFVGRWSLARAKQRGSRQKLVGFRLAGGVPPKEASLVIHRGKLGGRITSARWSPVTNSVIGLAWVPIEKAKNGEQIEILCDGEKLTAVVQEDPFYDAAGKKLHS
jgi:sarcosine oxidase subunit alpha